MKATLSLEYIGEAQDARLSLYGKMVDQVSDGLSKQVIGKTKLRQPWVAEITGLAELFSDREFSEAWEADVH